jgi:hypothetical protein
METTEWGRARRRAELGSYPELMIVVPAGCPFDRDPAFASIDGFVKRGIGNIDDVQILRVDRELAEIPAAAPDAIVARDPSPCRPGVIGTV